MASNALRLDALTAVDQDRIKPDVMAEIDLVGPEESVFLTLMARATGKRKAEQMSFKKPREFPFERVLKASAASSSATPLTILNYLYLVAGSVIRNNRTNELIYVTATPTSSSVAVTRGWGTTIAAAILATDDLLILNITITEGGAIPDAVQRNTEHLTYYLGHSGRTIDITDIMDGSKQWGIPERTRLLDQQIREWNKDKNLTLMYGQPVYNTSGNLLTAQTAGLDYYTSKYNPYDCGGVFTYAKMVDGFTSVWKSTGVREFWLLMPTAVANGMAFWNKTVFDSRSEMGAKTLGFDVSTIMIQGGIKVHMVTDLATELGANQATGVFKCYGVNMNDVTLTGYMEGGKVERGVQERGVFRTSKTVHDYFGLLVKRPESHIEFNNIETVA